ncbi:MAG: 2-C-methyl-D-erythritol 4-phosphate cytidylyltransferase, partial [Lachnospiraceae bacterium]|nr:2-C-methyl-D-erythritol 4-phosphate cytidylyltransferase [Lachnospiraceae bacterium]
MKIGENSEFCDCAGCRRRAAYEKWRTAKQFLKLMGKPIIIYTLKKFEECEEIDKVIIVSHGAYVD